MSEKEHAATAIAGDKKPKVTHIGVLLLLCMFLTWTFPTRLYAHIPLTILYPVANLKKGTREVTLAAVLGLLWNCWNLILALPFALFFGPVCFALSSVLPILTLMLAIGRVDKAVMPFGGGWWIRVNWDPPLLLMVRLCWLLNVGFLHDGSGNWFSIIDDDIAVSSMPLPRHRDTLRAAGIKSVVNLQIEYGGPVDMYDKAGIKQLRLPTVDMSSPTEEDLRRGIEFIRNRKEAYPDSRVLIHCKGGRGRAVTMALAWLVSTGSYDLEDGFRLLKSKRECAEAVVKSYGPLRLLADDMQN